MNTRLCLICTTILVILDISEASTHQYFLLDNNPEKVKISVFYETYCPYSVKFIKKQLLPTHNLLSDYIELDLVPYGKSKQTQVNGTWSFTCQHGPKECYANKVHACVVSKLNENGQHKTLDFIACTFNVNYTDTEIKQCSNKVGINWTSLRQCYSTPEGDNILAGYGVRTHNTKPAVKYVPMVFFDDVFDRNVAEHAMDALLDVICRMIKIEKLDQCIEHDRLYLEKILTAL